jgi:hypothetical protein
MQTITLNAHADSDGFLHLKVPRNLINRNFKVKLIVQPEELGWTPGFFEKTAGAWEGEPLTRGEQGEYEQRETLL